MASRSYLAVAWVPGKGKKLWRNNGNGSPTCVHSREKEPLKLESQRPICVTALGSRRTDKNGAEVWTLTLV